MVYIHRLFTRKKRCILRKTHIKLGLLLAMTCLFLAAGAFVGNGTASAQNVQATRKFHHWFANAPHITVKMLPSTARHASRSYTGRAVIYGVGFNDCSSCSPATSSDTSCNTGCDNTSPADTTCTYSGCSTTTTTDTTTTSTTTITTNSQSNSVPSQSTSCSNNTCSNSVPSQSTTYIAPAPSNSVPSQSTSCPNDCSNSVPSQSTSCYNTCSNSVPSQSTSCYNTCSNSVPSQSTSCSNTCSNSVPSQSTSCSNACSNTVPSQSTSCSNACSNTVPSANDCSCNTVNLQSTTPISASGINLSQVPVNAFGEFQVTVNVPSTTRQYTVPTVWAVNSYNEQPSNYAPMCFCG